MPDKIRLVVPEPDIDDPGDDPITPILISPEGADPNREVPGFFIIQIDGESIKMENPPTDKPWMPRQFLSLDAVHTWLRETYGWKVPLRVTSHVRITERGARDFPAVWGAERRIGKKQVRVRVRYLGSFRYWDGRRVDPTKVGTSREFN
jgi:hypothetical protein